MTDLAKLAPDAELGPFELSEEHHALRATVRALAETEIAPQADDVDEHARYPAEARAALTPAGFHAITSPSGTAARAATRWPAAS